MMITVPSSRVRSVGRTPAPRRAAACLLALIGVAGARETGAQRGPPGASAPRREYEATTASLARHPLPAWFDDAKFGIFVHWDLASYPAWAPTPGPLNEIIADSSRGWRYWFKNNPYADWYLNTLKIDGSPVQQHHAATYGRDFAFWDFAPLFNREIQKWRPAEWATLFERAGARYVVLTTKHHDGFVLWPSATPNPHRGPGYRASRDVVGQLGAVVRERGMRYGLYYSGGIDWTFNDRTIADIGDLLKATPQDSAYVRYADAQIRELIDRYKPAVLWNDIAWPRASDPNAVFAYYYNRVPDGVVNNRFTQTVAEAFGTGRSARHFDFTTPEYSVESKITPKKWEATRGIGFSFAYNQNETEAMYTSADSLVRILVDVVSKNGNLLLNVGPMADGTIPPPQRARLEAMGAWLATNGEAIYGTRPWVRAEAVAEGGGRVRFTRRGPTVY
ncbi:MAG: GH29, partial [uncultured Gemmatimonadaceae bacterium]